MSNWYSEEFLKSFPFYGMLRTCYDEPHRFYHTWNHIVKMLKLFEVHQERVGTIEHEKEILFSILFHDAYYDPRAKDNEERSVEIMRECLAGSEYDVNMIANYIMTTKNPAANYMSSILVQLDVYELANFSDAVRNDELIFKEYEFVDFYDYKRNRFEIISKISNVHPAYIEYINMQKKNIAVYAGSFDPFHLGHMNIYEKACKIFDKVIIACGKNPGKGERSYDLPKDYLKYKQVDFYDGLLTDYLDSKKYDVTLVRGLRNTSDLQYELTQSRYLQMMKPNIKTVNIFCDNTLEHISSSSIKELQKFGKGGEYIVK